MARVVLLSDIHISPTHGFFWDNWLIARDWTNAAGADAAIVTGDLAINGPDSDAEIEFAARALAELEGDVLVLPGNHDVGDEPPGQDAHQLIDEARLGRWDRSFGADRWSRRLGGWLLVGVNAQLLGSGLAREAEQDAWLEHQLAHAAGHPVALFLHKPVFLEDKAEAAATASALVPEARARLLQRLAGADVQLIVNGHLHQHRDRVVDGIRHLWAPSTAFAAPHDHGGDGRCGVLSLDFSPSGVRTRVERPEGLISHDLARIKENGRYKFLRDMPHSPPVLAA
jgi:3',5'-cyclic AMP phosphodiesterase CpdA